MVRRMGRMKMTGAKPARYIQKKENGGVHPRQNFAAILGKSSREKKK